MDFCCVPYKSSWFYENSKTYAVLLSSRKTEGTSSQPSRIVTEAILSQRGGGQGQDLRTQKEQLVCLQSAPEKPGYLMCVIGWKEPSQHWPNSSLMCLLQGSSKLPEIVLYVFLHYYIHFYSKFSISLGNVTCRKLPLGAGPALQLPPTSSTSKKLSESCPLWGVWGLRYPQSPSDVLCLGQAHAGHLAADSCLPENPFSLVLACTGGSAARCWSPWAPGEEGRSGRTWRRTITSAVWAVRPPKRSLRGPPMRQKRHLIFSMALLSTVFRRRMYIQGPGWGSQKQFGWPANLGFCWWLAPGVADITGWRTPAKGDAHV